MIPLWKRELQARLAAAAAAAGLAVDPAAVLVERARDPKLGDYASTVALALAKPAKRPPRELAQAILAALEPGAWFATPTVAGPGFINLLLAPAAVPGLLAEILAAGDTYGTSGLFAGQRVLVEFVSANPTGPLHIGHGRGAAYGDVIARLLAAAGATVEREYYLNDTGNQIATLGESLWARCRQAAGADQPLPENGYCGDYLAELAGPATAELGPPPAELTDALRQRYAEFAARRLLDEIIGDLERFRVTFNSFASEETFYRHGKVDAAVARLQAAGALEQKDGALWLRSDRHGDEKPRVVRRDDGRWTYLAADIAYHAEKFKRGYDLIVDVWGADHHGYLPRLRAALVFLGCDPARLRVQFLQMVRLFDAGQEIKMSKRSGSFVTLRDVTAAVPVDVARWFFLMRHHESQLDFDLAAARQQSDENPVYYVQYAHARICSILRNAPSGAADGIPEPAVLARLAEPEARDLAAILARFPEEVADAAEALEPQRLTGYLHDLTGQFHRYYDRNRVIGDDAELTRARLALVRAVKLTIANGLALLGITAPEQM